MGSEEQQRICDHIKRLKLERQQLFIARDHLRESLDMSRNEPGVWGQYIHRDRIYDKLKQIGNDLHDVHRELELLEGREKNDASFTAPLAPLPLPPPPPDNNSNKENNPAESGTADADAAHLKLHHQSPPKKQPERARVHPLRELFSTTHTQPYKNRS